MFFTFLSEKLQICWNCYFIAFITVAPVHVLKTLKTW